MKQMLLKLRTMKRIIPVFALAVAMTACNTTPDTATTQKAIQPAVDTTGLAQFQAWKAQNELVNTEQNAAMAQPQTREVIKYYPVSSAKRSSSSSSRSSGSSSSGTTASRKKGWSSAAKGAVIGGVAGAAGGAIINKKNRAAGAENQRP